MEIDNKEVTFDVSNLASSKSLYINATEIAKQFDKKPAYWLKTAEAKEYIEAVSRVANIPHEELVEIKQGGKHQGTWIHNKLMIRFAQWLNPTFAVMCDEKIQQILQGNTNPVSLNFNLDDIKRACIEAVKDEFLETKYIIKEELKATRSIINDVMSNVIAENQNFLDKAKNVVSTKSLTAEQLDILKTRIENKAKELSTSKKIRYEIAIKTIYSDLNSYYGIKSWYHLTQGDYDEALFVINNVSLDRGA
jgi:hypothetical protein